MRALHTIALLSVLFLVPSCDREKAHNHLGEEGVAGGVTATTSPETSTAPPATPSSPGADAVEAAPPDPLEGLTYPELKTEPLDKENVLDAPEAWEGVVPRVTLISEQRYGDLFHEANNKVMRGEQAEDGAYEDEDAVIVARWRRYAEGTRGVFVLRDSLFSQQDHPYRQDGFWPMLPPNWVTAATARAAAKQKIEGPATYPIEDDAAWKGKSIEQVFGVFPHSPSLHEQATADLEAIEDGAERDAATLRARRARAVLHHLARDVDAMRAAAPFGAEAVARAGAARIAFGDRAYFGEQTRREKIIPIFVEHPDAWEVEEGKGMHPPGAEVSDALVAMVTREVYRARLKDGALAIERYDISSKKDRARAIALLEALIPPNDTETSGKVWLWITGDLIEGKKLEGEDPLAHMPSFLEELEGAKIDRARLELFGKPTVFIRGNEKARREALERARDDYAAAGLSFVSVTLTSPALRNILE